MPCDSQLNTLLVGSIGTDPIYFFFFFFKMPNQKSKMQTQKKVNFAFCLHFTHQHFLVLERICRVYILTELPLTEVSSSHCWIRLFLLCAQAWHPVGLLLDCLCFFLNTFVFQEDLNFCNNFLLCYSGLWFLDISWISNTCFSVFLLIIYFTKNVMVIVSKQGQCNGFNVVQS